MSAWKAIAVLAAVTGCAGVQRTAEADLASGHWIGEIDRHGWRQPVALDIERDGEAWHGQWRAVRDGSGQAFESVEVQGHDVRFETGKLRFVGQGSGAPPTGGRANKVAGEPVGELSAINQPVFNPASEWSPPTI